MKKEEILKLEYERAENSGRFYENLIWTLSQIIITASAIMLYFVWKEEKILQIGLLIFGTFLSVYSLIAITTLSQKRKREYVIARVIEEKTNFIGKDRYNDKFPYLKTGDSFFVVGIILIVLGYLLSWINFFNQFGIVFFLMEVVLILTILAVYSSISREEFTFKKEVEKNYYNLFPKEKKR
ncbi:hypothetical protein M0R72_03595 [Candidatus Pacearchaeota archaeon]|jgi:hypothetical protein|nr:hypothetical protein [Candidatus Pacearchaeota archaeon]